MLTVSISLLTAVDSPSVPLYNHLIMTSSENLPHGGASSASLRAVGEGIYGVLDNMPHEMLADANTMLSLAQMRFEDAHAGDAGTIGSSLQVSLDALTKARNLIHRADARSDQYVVELGLAGYSYTEQAAIDALADADVAASGFHGKPYDVASVHSAFEKMLEGLPETLSLIEYEEYCKEFSKRIGYITGDRGPFMHLYQFYSAEMLPKIMPRVQPGHFSVDPESGSLTAMQPTAWENLPEAVHGVPTQDIVCLAAGILGLRPADTGRVDFAEGQCTTFTLAGLRDIISEYPQLQPHLEAVGFETPARRDPENPKNKYRLIPVSYNHTVTAVTYDAPDGRPMVLHMDVTIAQIDRKPDYDIEAVAVSAREYDKFLRLRYRTHPEVRIRRGYRHRTSATDEKATKA